ncbi:MAG: hypothetical protein ACLP7A_03465, partial [Desulfobaccales bacterium]
MRQKQHEKKDKGKWIDLLFRRIFPILYLIFIGLGVLISYYSMKSNAPEYSIVGKDGNILLNKGFGQYGLFVKENSFPIIDGAVDRMVPTYILKFNKVPAYFEIST